MSQFGILLRDTSGSQSRMLMLMLMLLFLWHFYQQQKKIINANAFLNESEWIWGGDSELNETVRDGIEW